MNQIDLNRQHRDETIFVRQSAQLKVVTDWRVKYDELMKHHRAQLVRETDNCREISALRAALIQAQADADKWRKRCEQMQHTTI